MLKGSLFNCYIQKGVNLITILPEVIKSPELTAEWESNLKQVERGELSDADFMNGIAELTGNLIKTNTAANPEYLTLFASFGRQQSDTIGVCPRCGKSIRESDKGFFCENKACQFALWKDNKFFSSKKKVLTSKIAAALLKDGRVSMTGLYSEKTGKTYDAAIILDDSNPGDGEYSKYVSFKMEFDKK